MLGIDSGSVGGICSLMVIIPLVDDSPTGPGAPPEHRLGSLTSASQHLIQQPLFVSAAGMNGEEIKGWSS